MVEKEVVLQTIKKLLQSGVDEETIKSTMKEIGLDDSQIKEFLEQAKGIEEEPEEAVQKTISKEDLLLQNEQDLETGDLEEDDDNNLPEELQEKELDDDTEPPEELVEEAQEESRELTEEDPVLKKHSLHEKIAKKTAQKVKRHISDKMQEQELLHTTTHAELAEHRNRLSDVHKSLDSLHTKMDLAPQMPMQTISKINSIEKRINSMEKELAEIRANTNALSSLLKKIIETEREVLNELKKRN